MLPIIPDILQDVSPFAVYPLWWGNTICIHTFVGVFVSAEQKGGDYLQAQSGHFYTK